MAQKIATICFRITSVYIIYWAILSVAIALSRLQFLWGVSIAVILVGNALMLMLGVFMWRYAHVLPEKLLWIENKEFAKQPITTLFFRITGLYLFFWELQMFVWQAGFSIGAITDGNIGIVLDIMFPLFLALVGVLTWRFADVLATRFARGAEDGKSGPLISWDDSDE